MTSPWPKWIPKKCAVCYTCPRLCPHSAITVEKYAEKNIYAPPGKADGTNWGAARVNPVACYGCGICVAECPAKAITLLHLGDEQIYSQMGLPVNEKMGRTESPYNMFSPPLAGGDGGEGVQRLS